MARRRSRKIQPAIKSLYFNVPSDPAPADPAQPQTFATSYIDLSLAASAINRRFIRQGLNWAVGGFTLYNESPNQGTVRISKLPDSWAIANAWTKSFKLWQEMQDQVAENNESLRARYNDFKIYAEGGMVNATIQNSWIANPDEILMPISGPFGTGQYVCKFGEWQYSDITIPYGDAAGTGPADFALHMLGGDLGTTSKSMILGYGESRSRPQQEDPNVPGTYGWMTELFDVGEQLEEIQENFEDENDQPPYRVGVPDDGNVYIPGANNNLPNMEIHSAASFTATTVSGKQQIGGTNALCGLLRLDAHGFHNIVTPVTELPYSGLFLQVHLVPGPMKGYMCQKMQDVN